MTSTLLLTLALLAPTMAYAAAFSPPIPGPTQFLAAVDSWSPAPTAAPQLPFDVFRRQQQAQGSNTCGWASGNSGTTPPSVLNYRKFKSSWALQIIGYHTD
jgi:hypothetical protein